MSKLFKTPALTFEEFIAPRNTGAPAYNNFFYNFYNYSPGEARNYERFKKIDKKLANQLSNVHATFTLNSKKIPDDIVKKGYKAYLILRDKLKNDVMLEEEVREYNEEKKNVSSDDWAAFFA